jgi:hypothetical protein
MHTQELQTVVLLILTGLAVTFMSWVLWHITLQLTPPDRHPESRIVPLQVKVRGPILVSSARSTRLDMPSH